MEKIYVKDALDILEGAVGGALGYIGGSFMAGISSSIGFSQLGSLPLGLFVGGLFFFGIALPKLRINHHVDDENVEVKS